MFTGRWNEKMFLVMLVCLATVMAARASDVEPMPCKVKIQTRHLPSFFNMNNKPLKSETFVITVSEESADSCYLNLTEAVTKMAFPTFPVLEVIGIICKSHKRVYFTEYEGQQAKHIIFHVEVKLCIVEMENLNHLLKVGDTRVLLVSGMIKRREETLHLRQEDALEGVVSFFYEIIGTEKQNITDIFKINASYPLLAEIILKNVTFDMCSVQLSKVFPNLQSLELLENDLTLPPDIFPWATDLALLPRNLSRSPLMQNHYIHADFIEIPSNVFRRYLNLDGNAIHNLSEYLFHGHIDKISLKGNELHVIGDSTFNNVTQLQHLDLSNNMITEIPHNAFKGLTSLRKLELSGNQIQLMQNNTSIFDDLISLRFLGLANNSLEFIPTRLFETLKHVEVIRLERNKLVSINPYSFPLDSVKLNEIHFQFNPITDLPQFPFYIRSLRLANFHATHIAFENFTSFLETFVDFQVYNAVVDSASNADRSDLLERAEVLRKIDLSDCNITNIHLIEHPPAEITNLLKVLLLHFEFDLTNNPIICDCNMNTLIDFIQENAKNCTIPENEYFFNDWLCRAPTELDGRKMLSVKPEETYCEISISRCPQECTCYERATVKQIIVDCRNKTLSSIHRNLPDAKLELWYSGNKINNIISFPSPENIIVLDVSRNKLETITGEAIQRMKTLKVLRLDSNVLAYIPKEIAMLKNLEAVNIVSNPLTCDCQTLWMKDWLKLNKLVIKDWYKVACKVENEDGMVLTEVPDDKFVCNKDPDDIMRIVLPSVTCSVLTLLFVILFVVTYAYRLECKVLMFVYFGIHPFDRDSQTTNENLDCVIVHSGLHTDWVMEKIVSLLENGNYEFVVCDMARDFVIGYSFQENLTRTVRHSKRMIFCLSEDWKTSSDSFTTAWRIAQEKIKDIRSHYGIIVSHEINKKDIHDKDLRRFIEHGRFVDSKDRLFGNKIVYYMPQVVKIRSEVSDTVNFRNVERHISRCFINSYCEDIVQDQTVQRSNTFEDQQPSQNIETNARSHAFISYHDKDIQYILKELLPLLEGNGFSYCIPDRDFVPGASIEENILNAIDRSHRTIFILSPSHVEDEWSLFTFRAAYEKALREKSNHLLVIIKEEVEDKDLDEEIRHYLNNYICLNVNDRWFEKKLYNGLPLLKNREDFHTSPLFLRCVSVDENDVTIEVNMMSLTNPFTILYWLVIVYPVAMERDIPPPCVTMAQNQDLFSYFHMDGKPLKSVGYIVKVLSESEDFCSLNTTKMVEEMSLPSYPRENAIAIACKQQKGIHLTNYVGDPQKHIIAHVEIVNCTIDMTNINRLLNVADTKVLVIMSKINKTTVTNDNNSTDGLQNVVSFVLEHIYKEVQHLSNIFDINKAYPHLAEISLKNISLEKLPTNISEIFPNLQSLELPENKLILPPAQFPWIDTTVRLPRNISRSPFMQSHYSTSDFIDIPDNIFRRYFTLDDNRIEDLNNFSFHGLMHKISLKRNGLKTLGSKTFRNVTGLQNLDLSENDLRLLPEGVFSGLVSLKFLDISSNHLQNLTTGLFHDLFSLKILSLANNSISSLPTGLFTNLHKLEVLRLDHNDLVDVNQNAFPLESINLKKLYFHFNPLRTLPEFPFWIRSLNLADFHATDITFHNFTMFLEEIDALKVYHSVVNSASSSDIKDLLERAEVLKKIDVSNSNISSLQLEETLPKELEKLLLVLLLHFEFDLRNNPIHCDCNINSLSKFIDTNVLNGTIPEDEYFFRDWVCHAPTELAGRKMLKVEHKDTYCTVNVSSCPLECACYERATVNRIIVDCRNKTLFHIHTELPEGVLELWYRENNITEIKSVTNPERIYMLDVSFNNIIHIDANVFTGMDKLKELRLQANALAYLPNDLTQLNLSSVSIWPNPFTCDCKTLWMKTWLESYRKIINESYKVACKIENGDGMRFTEVPDDKFICHETPNFDEIRYVVVPSIVCSTVVVLALIFALLFYTYRLECKVLLFVYFGVHPFDKDSAKMNETIDCVVVHSGVETDWVMEKIVSLLENENYHFVVCDMARDFVIGYSFQENLTRTVRHSKRMIFCLSHDWPKSSEKLGIAWRIAQEKIKETKSHYGIIVSHEMKVNDINDKELKRFVKRGRFVDSKDRLFRDKIVYYMPESAEPHNDKAQLVHFRKKSEYISRCFINSYCEDMAKDQESESNPETDLKENTNVFISYHDNDFHYVLKELLPLFEEKGFSYCIADRDFVPGASIEENILNAINRSHRTLFILSPSHVEDEWSLFAFRTAYEKSLREKSNHLLVLVKEEVENKNLDEEISHYLKNYICLNINDKWFEKKLFNGLPLLKNKEDLHTSPLFIRKESLSEEEIKVDFL
ncbi:uncharacterized protein LOC123554932 [Mercenaria mercenaria]|uniref:uncharacterized protein LOC123554932 n=1 Tax=Mercenaria mercenaria TaxID=6596 RepID=UPI00234E3EA0|nr:uncharacterized protein LOC123554932 [Mercenaria mercenaria]